MPARKRQFIVLIEGEPYYSAQKAEEKLKMTYSGVRYQVSVGNIQSETPKGRKQAYYRAKDVEELAKELQTYALNRKKTTELLRVSTREEMAACLEIAQATFGPGRATTDERMKILEKNPDLYYLLRDNDQPIGYFAILPVKPGKLGNVLNQTLPTRIDPDDVADFNEDKNIDLYLHAIAVKPGLSLVDKRSYSARLLAGLVSTVIGWGKKGIVINTIAARSGMPDGIRIMKHAGFTEIEPLTPERRTFIIDVKQSGIPFLMEYKAALKEASAK